MDSACAARPEILTLWRGCSVLALQALPELQSLVQFLIVRGHRLRQDIGALVLLEDPHYSLVHVSYD